MKSPEEHRDDANAVMDAVRALVRSGDYDRYDLDEVEHLYDLAAEMAGVADWRTYFVLFTWSFEPLTRKSLP